MFPSGGRPALILKKSITVNTARLITTTTKNLTTQITQNNNNKVNDTTSHPTQRLFTTVSRDGPPVNREFCVAYEDSFKSKSTFEIARAFSLLHLGSIPFFVKNARHMVNVSRKLLGDKITDFILGKTLAAQFTGGESLRELEPVISIMNKNGIGAILDYAAEADVPDTLDDPSPKQIESELEQVQEWALGGEDMKLLYPHAVFEVRVEKGDMKFDNNPLLEHREEHYPSARTFFYTGNEQCDSNKEICELAIRTASKQTIPPFAAIKITALLDPYTLISVAKIVKQLHSLFPHYDQVDYENGDYCPIPTQDFLDLMKRNNPELKANWHIRTSSAWPSIAELGANGTIDFVDWVRWCDDPSVWTADLSHPICFTPAPIEDLAQVLAGFNRAAELARVAQECGVRLMIDAEQTYFQPTIDLMTRLLQYKLNTETPVVWNTYQCYRKDACNRMLLDQELFKRENVIFGCKFVRGAYVVQERKRAKDQNYPDPICDTIEDTHENYDKCVRLTVPLVIEGKAEFMLASHNQHSVEKAVHLMLEANLPPSSPIFFGQLLGMGDHITASLAQREFNCYKYVPYGPVNETVPYLIRRIEENSTMLAGEPVVQERKMMYKELKARFFGTPSAKYPGPESAQHQTR